MQHIKLSAAHIILPTKVKRNIYNIIITYFYCTVLNNNVLFVDVKYGRYSMYRTQKLSMTNDKLKKKKIYIFTTCFTSSPRLLLLLSK